MTKEEFALIVKENIIDFEDMDEDLKYQLEVEIEEIYKKATNAYMRYFNKIGELGDKVDVGSKIVNDILKKAEKAFDKVWLVEAWKLMKPQLTNAMRRGVLQNQSLEEVTNG